VLIRNYLRVVCTKQHVLIHEKNEKTARAKRPEKCWILVLISWNLESEDAEIERLSDRRKDSFSSFQL
jgi:hypothetical protein